MADEQTITPLSAEDHAKLQQMLTEFYDAIGHKDRTWAAGIAYDIVGQQVIEALLTENAAMRTENAALRLDNAEGRRAKGEIPQLQLELSHQDVEIDQARALHNEAWDLIDRLSEDLADHEPIAHDWLIDEANTWRAKHPKTP